MRILLILFAITTLSCDSEKAIILPSSSGNLNEVSVVMENELWNTEPGQTIKSILSSPLYGLPQKEPKFSLRQIPPSIFSGFVTKSRNIIKFEQSNKVDIELVYNKFAIPQTMIIVKARLESDFRKTILKNKKLIEKAFNNSEIKEKQRRIKKSLLKIESLEEDLKIKIDIPSAYRVAAATDSFYWIRKDIKTGSINVMIYELPFEDIDLKLSTPSLINQIRNSFTQIHIPGPKEGSYMLVDSEYQTKEIDNNKKFTETRGIWEVEDQFMAGPFINLFIKDPANKRALFLDGFVYAPSENKRNYIFEAEAIIKSFKTLSN